jgi:hypothetical protein
MSKDFDAVGMVRKIRDDIYEQTKDMSAKELVDYFREHGTSAEEWARREEVRALSEMDGMDLANPEVMAGAWPTPKEIPEPCPQESEPSACESEKSP